MPYSPAPTPPWPGESESPLAPDSDRARPDKETCFAQHESVLGALRDQVAAGDQDTATLLDAITVAAQIVTDASGSALGIRRDNAVQCVGRSGETAPALGTHLSEESGISGECLRMGRTLRCGDTETDPRVDAEVCRALNIRAIAAVPIRSSNSTMGVLEVFSTEAHAFTDEHIAFLSSLAGLVETACSNVDFPEYVVALEGSGLQEHSPSALTEPRTTSAFWAASPWWQEPKRRYAGAAAAALVAVLSIVGWYQWRTSTRDASTQEVMPKAVASISEEIPTPTVAESRAKPEPGRTTVDPSTRKPPLVQASKKEIDEPLVRRFDREPPMASISVAPQPPGRDASVVEPSEPPKIQPWNGGADSINGLVKSNANLPALGVPVSQGVTPLVLERRVSPIYPAQALSQKLEGTVVLQAFVDASGRVDQVNILSGPPLLGRAAMDAVKNWRYRPSLLNGKPVRAETRITIYFQASSSR